MDGGGKVCEEGRETQRGQLKGSGMKEARVGRKSGASIVSHTPNSPSSTRWEIEKRGHYRTRAERAANG